MRTSSLLGSTQSIRYSAGRHVPIRMHRAFRLQYSSHCALSVNALGPSRRTFSVSRSLQSLPTSASEAIFSYRIGAAFSAKDCRFNPKEDSFNFNSQLPAASKKGFYTGRPKSGQDAFFISGGTDANNMAFGVADGVGGWSDSGIDSAHFSHGLCQWMARIADEAPRSEKRSLAPRTLLRNAYDSIVKDGKIVGGGSTACVAVGDRDGTLRVAKCVYAC
jgi:protein phosphatase PTC7